MKFHDPQRPHLTAGVPCWLTAPHIALPRISVRPWPLENKELIRTDEWPYAKAVSKPRFSLEIIIDGSQKIIVQPLEIVMDILADYFVDPESALQNWWHVDPPTSYRPQETASQSAMLIARADASLEDL